MITGARLRNARAGQDEFRPWETSFTLSQDGGKRFGRFTGANIGNRLAVVLDNQIISVATIQSKIDDSGRINGSFERAGSVEPGAGAAVGLAAGGNHVSSRSARSDRRWARIRSGRASMAGIAGLVAVIVVMLVYYKSSGVNAVLALMLNTIMLMAALSYFDATLTLPGIAGIILTIGMAVDTNVLIFERIREELRTGKDDSRRGGRGFRQGLVDDRRYARDDHRFVRVSVPVRDRSGARVRGDAGDRSVGQRVYGGVRVEGDLRLGTVAQPAGDGAEHLKADVGCWALDVGIARSGFGCKMLGGLEWDIRS